MPTCSNASTAPGSRPAAAFPGCLRGRLRALLRRLPRGSLSTTAPPRCISRSRPLGIGPGDEVIVPNLTYIASANAVTYCGAKPVFVDCEPATLNLDPRRIEARITPRTQGDHAGAHLRPSGRHGPDRGARARARPAVVEDAAEAHGAAYRGPPVGGIGDCATFSFYGNKIITTGEGGMVLTDDAALAARLRRSREGHGPAAPLLVHRVVGFNYRMTNVAAAIGLAQLERIDTILSRPPRQVAAWYAVRLAGIEGTCACSVPSHGRCPYPGWSPCCSPEAVSASGTQSWRRSWPTASTAVRSSTRAPAGALSRGDPLSGRRDMVGPGLNLPTFEAMTEADVAAVCASLRRAIARYADVFPGAPPSEVREPEARRPRAAR